MEDLCCVNLLLPKSVELLLKSLTVYSDSSGLGLNRPLRRITVGERRDEA